LWRARTRADHLTWASTLGTRALPTRLSAHDPVVRLAGAARAATPRHLRLHRIATPGTLLLSVGQPPATTTIRPCSREHPPGLLVQVGDGRAVNCAGAWSCLWRAGIPRSLLSPPGEGLWRSGPMDHGVQRRERGGGQAAGPAARPELAAPSAAAVPREIPTCSASLLFRRSGRKPPPATGSSFARLLRCLQRPAGQRLGGSRAPGACLLALPVLWRHNHYAGQAQPSHSAQPVVAREPRLQWASAPPAHCHAAQVCLSRASSDLQADLVSGSALPALYQREEGPPAAIARWRAL
jgi:hypothetical protein